MIRAPLPRTKILYIFRGLPGSGKSTAAREIGCIVVEPQDHWSTRDGVYEWVVEERHLAVHNSQTLVDTLMRLEYDIVVAEVLPRVSDCQVYLDLAESYGYEVRVTDLMISVDLAHQRCAHEVPREHLQDYYDRWEDWSWSTVWNIEEAGEDCSPPAPV